MNEDIYPAVSSQETYLKKVIPGKKRQAEYVTKIHIGHVVLKKPGDKTHVVTDRNHNYVRRIDLEPKEAVGLSRYFAPFQPIVEIK